jgi:hypothetical protein
MKLFTGEGFSEHESVKKTLNEYKKILTNSDIMLS